MDIIRDEPLGPFICLFIWKKKNNKPFIMKLDKTKTQAQFNGEWNPI